MTKLNQIIAIEKGVKAQSHSLISELYKKIQKTELFNGFAKSYQKLVEDAEDLPAENKKVQTTTGELLQEIKSIMIPLLDVTARKDFTNCEAKADIILESNVVVTNVPVSHLLFLEKQLTDLRTFIGALPILDTSEEWLVDSNSDFLFKTPITQTHRTKKEPKAIVLYPATPEHPAQTQMIAEDRVVGFWNTTKISGAIAPAKKTSVLLKVDALLKAVKVAREEANMTEVVDCGSIGEKLFEALF